MRLADIKQMSGRLAEWSIAVVLKTIEPKGSGGSNPSPSAKCFLHILQFLQGVSLGVQGDGLAAIPVRWVHAASVWLLSVSDW